MYLTVLCTADTYLQNIDTYLTDTLQALVSYLKLFLLTSFQLP